MFYSPLVRGNRDVVNSQTLPSGNSWMGRPRPSEHNIMFPVKEISYTHISICSPFHTAAGNQNSPVYAGYNSISSNPSCLSSTELVHSHTPPISPCPASLSPFAVTATGCQCLKPTLAPSRSVKSALCGPAGWLAGSRNGGLSSTPSLTRWL